ncbi:MAG: TCP-1/cpn60 chaperonin family protein [Candidatus Thermoplasmatota archaeon]
MDGVLHGRHAATGDLRQLQEATAAWVEAFLGPGYGPHGGAKLVDGPEPLWVRSPAMALREVQATPDLAPYQDLAARVLAAAGDGGTTSVLLAARLVRLALTSDVGVQAFVQGYPLARRQALAALSALAHPADPAEALAGASPGGAAWSRAVLAGLADASHVDLDAIEVVAGPADQPEWLPGIPLEPQRAPRHEGPARVLLLASSWSVKPRSSAQWRSATGAFAAEEALRRQAADRVTGLGVGVVACTGAIDEGLAGLLQDRGVAVATDVALSRLRRLAAATGATPLANALHATAADLGDARLQRRPHRTGGWLVCGAGPGRTLLMPGGNAMARAGAIEAGERLLRAAGLVLADARAVPGAGAWQREIAAALLRAADAAPGRTPFALRAAAEAFLALDRDLARNAAGQAVAPTLDAFACVRRALASAFDCAQAIVRLDARLDKRPSGPAGLRGGLGRAGSPKGMPGDLPPLM